MLVLKPGNINLNSNVQESIKVLEYIKNSTLYA